MRTAIIIVLLVFGFVGSALAQSLPATGSLIPPPAINIPYGGKIVTEINIGEDNILGIIKQMIPAAAEMARDFAAPSESASASPEQRPVPGNLLATAAAAGSVDVAGLMDAISGIKGVRFIVAKYPMKMNPEQVLAQFDKGAAKSGAFTKIASDFAMFPGAFALYAQPNNGGYLVLAYEPQQKTVYGARIVGFADVGKLVEWVTKTVKSFKPAAFGPVRTESAPEPKLPG